MTVYKSITSACVTILAGGLLLFASNCAVLAQGGQGGLGGGQGGFGGGSLGSQGARGADNAEDGNRYTHILTPGDRGEWPLTVAGGETVIVAVSSTTFDPAAQIVDSTGKVLAENDDVRPGDQDSLILYRFEKAGDYKVLVKGFKSVAGGQYSLTMRRFQPLDLKRGQRNGASLTRNRLVWHRFGASVGETIVLTTRSAIFTPHTELYAPSGERVSTDIRIHGGGRIVTDVFTAPTKGDYFLRVASGDNSTGGYAVTAAPAHVSDLTKGLTSPGRHLDAGGLDLWTFGGNAGDLVRIFQAPTDGPDASLSVKYVPVTQKAGESAPQDQERAITVLPFNSKHKDQVLALLRRKGNYQIEVSQPYGVPIDYRVTLTDGIKAWSVGPETAGKLSIGGCDYLAMDGKAGQIVRLAATSDQFDAFLELYNSKGERIEANDDGGGGTNAMVTGLLKETGKYFVRIASSGDGGGGSYTLVKRPDPTQGLSLGTRTEAKLGIGSSDVWSFSGNAGQTFILSIRSQEIDASVTVFGPDTVEVANDSGELDTVDSLLSIHLPITGTYTVWINSRTAGGKYSIRLIDAG